MLQMVMEGAVPADNGSVAVALPETLDRLNLVLSMPGGSAHLGLAAVAALRALLVEAEARMAAAPPAPAG